MGNYTKGLYCEETALELTAAGNHQNFETETRCENELVEERI